MLKTLINRFVGQERVARLFDLLEGMDAQGKQQVRVLTYHLIEDAAAFEKQMEFLSAGYRVVGMPDLLDACLRNKPLPPKAVLITFDDAYRNFAECAWPILKRHGFPATLFVPTAYPDHPEKVFWWDQLEYSFAHTPRRNLLQTPVGSLPLETSEQRTRAFKQLRGYVKTLSNEQQALSFVEQVCAELNVPKPVSTVLSWEELRRLSGEGVTLGGHTRSHPLLNRVTLNEARDEIIGSLRDLQREVDNRNTEWVFAYPDGAVTPVVAQVVREAGFSLAFTTRRGTIDLAHFDPMLIRRNNIGQRATQPILRARLLQASPHLGRIQPILGR